MRFNIANVLYELLLLAKPFFTAFLVVYISLPLLSRAASKIGLVDHPDKRKIHTNPKPLVGGIGILLGILASLMFIEVNRDIGGFILGMSVLAVIGFLDDYKGMRASVKFICQIIATCLLVVMGGSILYTFGDLLHLGEINLGSLSVPFTIFCTVGVINAINMIDGIDGLAGGISLVAFLSFRSCLR